MTTLAELIDPLTGLPRPYNVDGPTYATDQGGGWANTLRELLQPDRTSTYGNILPAASSTQYRNPTTLDAQGRAIHGAEQAYTEKRPAMPMMLREVLGNAVNYADAPRAAAMGEMDPNTPENVEMLARGAFDAGAAGMVAGPRVPAGAIRSGGARTSKLTDAEQRAQNIIDMLTSGKASSVTDDMLAAADQKYLFDNYDLPMDTPSRMARAQEMGFGDTPLYHGSAAEGGLTEFDMAKAGTVSTQPNETAAFFTERPESASWFANYAHPDGELVQYGGAGEGFVLPSKVRGNLTDTDFRGQEYSNDWMAERIARAREEGSDGVNIKGMRENMDGYDPIDKQRAIFDPSNIRSQYARFDPRLAANSNLSASGMNPMAAIMGALSGQMPEENMAKLREYLGQ